MTTVEKTQASREVMKRLFWLRWLAIAMQLVAIALAFTLLPMNITATPLLAVVGLLALFNLIVGLRLQRSFAVSDPEIMLHLIIDAMGLAALLYFAGGSTNPFVSLFLVPVVLAAAYLRGVFVFWVVIACALLYTFLMTNYLPLPQIGNRFGGDFMLHVYGMWATFIISALVSAILVYSLSRTGRRRDRQLAEMQQRLLRNEHIVSVGAMAAGTAHELNTPLSTIAMLAEEIELQTEGDGQLREDAREIATQVTHCKERLQRLQQAAEMARGSGGKHLALDEALMAIITAWGALRSEIELTKSFRLEEAPMIFEKHALSMILMNLLNNAADASLENDSSRIAVSAETDGDDLRIVIEDFGKGLSDEQRRIAGNASFSTKQEGLGLGLIISSATLEQLEGELRMEQLSHGGTATCVRIPLDSLTRRETGG
ncbi:MAG: ATP-binding protein [Gammaproteobacteria bacterium]|jgi:two-component system, sensor histidine kinase RegB